MFCRTRFTVLLSCALFLGQAACQLLRGNIYLFTTNNQCDCSDGCWECGNKPAGYCCFIANRQFILSTKTQLISSPGGGRTTHILTGFRFNNPCNLTIHQDPTCARTSVRDTAEGGTYSWRSNSAGPAAAAADATADAAGANCAQADSFHIIDGNETYVASVDNTTIHHLLSLGREDKLAWAKENGGTLRQK